MNDVMKALTLYEVNNQMRLDLELEDKQQLWALRDGDGKTLLTEIEIEQQATSRAKNAIVVSYKAVKAVCPEVNKLYCKTSKVIGIANARSVGIQMFTHQMMKECPQRLGSAG